METAWLINEKEKVTVLANDLVQLLVLNLKPEREILG